MIREPVWLDIEDVLQLHRESLEMFGGMPGIRSEDGLRNAMERARNRCHYEGCEDVFDLASEYAFGIMKNHPFVDGNKRGGFLAAGAFLEINDFEVDGDEVELTNACLLLAAGEWSAEEFAFWLRENSVRA